MCDEGSAAGRSLQGAVTMTGDVTIGDPLVPSSLALHAPIAGAFPLSFSGPGPPAPGGPRVALGVEAPAGPRVLVLPDASGTLLTAGSLPDALPGAVFTGDTVDA
jgi:hypothetical protein